MKTLKSITDKYPTLYQAGKALRINQQQLKRWIDNDAHVNKDGEVYIKTKGNVPVSNIK